jgi:hypothetical protein
MRTRIARQPAFFPRNPSPNPPSPARTHLAAKTLAFFTHLAFFPRKSKNSPLFHPSPSASFAEHKAFFNIFPRCFPRPLPFPLPIPKGGTSRTKGTSACFWHLKLTIFI